LPRVSSGILIVYFPPYMKIIPQNLIDDAGHGHIPFPRQLEQNRY
jgi:hypothetical protein